MPWSRGPRRHWAVRRRDGTKTCRSRIVIEADGAHHYGNKNPADENGRVTYTASPRLYAEIPRRTTACGCPATRSTASAAGNSPGRTARGSSPTSLLSFFELAIDQVMVP